MKIRAMGVDVFYADGTERTDMTKLILAFRNFEIAPKNELVVTEDLLYLYD